MRINKKSVFIISIMISITALLIYVFNQFVYFNYVSLSDFQYKVGIIDGSLQKKYHCIVETNIKKYNTINYSHGDEIIDFLEEVSDLKIYYFDASEQEGNINSGKILEGLKWMKDNEVSFVNISLSSRKYSKDIDKWIKDFKDEITVYASYNNKKESSDYPAMYEYVKGSGTNKDVMDEEKDRIYKNNSIIINRNKIVKGNSFLSIITLLDDIIEEK